MRGSSDGLVTAAEAQQWAAATTAEFSYVEFPGDHMFLVDQGPELLNVIEGLVARDRGRAGSLSSV